MEPNIPKAPQPRLKERFDDICAVKHLSLSTRRSYWGWIVRYVNYHKAKSSDELCEQPHDRFKSFVSTLARRDVAVSTQNQCFNALMFLYEKVLGETLGTLPDIPRAKRPVRLMDVPATHEETMKLLNVIHGDVGLALRLAYGAALRVSETVRIRLRDLDFARDSIIIRGGKGDKDGCVPLPKSLAKELKLLVKRRELEHESDLATGQAWTFLPGQYGRKNPKAHFETSWQWLFSSKSISRDPLSGNYGRHHLLPEVLQAAMRKACAELKLKKNFSPHSLRHASAREMERRGALISEIQRCLRHSDIATTQRYLGVGTGGRPNVISPLD